MTIIAQNEMLFGFGDGYGAIEAARAKGWRPIPSWGRDGWDLGAWPLVIVLFRERFSGRVFEVAEYVEGDVTVRQFATPEARIRYVDGVAMWWWKHRDEEWVADYELGEGPRPEHCGPYTRERTA